MNRIPVTFLGSTYVVVESFYLLTWGGIVKKLIGWWRDGSNSLDVEQPTEVSNNNSGAFQSLVNAISQGIYFRGGRPR